MFLTALWDKEEVELCIVSPEFLKKREPITGIESIKGEKKLSPNLMSQEANQQNKHGMTELMVAAKNLDVKAVKKCLEAGGDPEIENSRDNDAKAMSYAFRAQHASMSEGEKRDYKIIRQMLKAVEGS